MVEEEEVEEETDLTEPVSAEEGWQAPTTIFGWWTVRFLDVSCCHSW